MKPNAKTQRSPVFLDQPEAEIRIGVDSETMPDRIRCRILVVEFGVRLSAIVQAKQVFIHGEVVGHVRASQLTVATTGVLIGEAHAETLNVAGRVNALVVASAIVARNGSKLEGEVVADKLARQDAAVLLARVAVGPGFAMDPSLAAAGRARLAGPSQRPQNMTRPAQHAVSAETVVELEAPSLPRFSPAAASAQPAKTPFLLH